MQRQQQVRLLARAALPAALIAESFLTTHRSVSEGEPRRAITCTIRVSRYDWLRCHATALTNQSKVHSRNETLFTDTISLGLDLRSGVGWLYDYAHPVGVAGARYCEYSRQAEESAEADPRLHERQAV